MIFPDKIASLFDENAFGDSFGRSSLFKIQSYTFVQGGFEGVDFQDYYKLDLPAGDYTLYFSTNGLNEDQVLNSSFKIEIVDSFGAVVLREDLSHPDSFTDQISFSYSGSGDYYLKASSLIVSDFRYEAAVYRADVDPTPTPTPSQPPIVPARPDADEWRLLASDGHFSGVGGSGQVFGTAGYQNVTILDNVGSIALDPSFNRGGDIVNLFGEASDWVVARSGSSVILYNDETFVQIPVGIAGLALNFTDGLRNLRIDTEASEIKIGSFVVTSDYQYIDSEPDMLEPPVGFDPDASGRLLMTSGSEVTVGGNLSFFGTAGTEKIIYLLGQGTFDPSFNRGGDELYLVATPEALNARAVGSSVNLEGAGYDLSIPAGIAGMDISFSGEVRTLFIDTAIGKIALGDDLIGSDAAPLSIV